MPASREVFTPMKYRILAAIDLERGTDHLLREVRRYAKALGAVVDIVHVAPPDPDFIGYQVGPNHVRENVARRLRTEHRDTQKYGAELAADGIAVDHSLTVQGSTLSTILEHARKLKPDLLILGSHHHGLLYRVWYGDVAKQAVDRTPCNLLIVPVD